jgi:hypothetical protein
VASTSKPGRRTARKVDLEEIQLMKKLCLMIPVALMSMAAMAEEFNGSQPMDCTPTVGHDCLPTEAKCSPLKPEKGKPLVMHVDVERMALKTPYRTAELPIASFGNNTKSLVLQGTNLELVWSATINRTTGRLTLAIADREGAYVIFGQCKVVPKGATAQ